MRRALKYAGLRSAPAHTAGEFLAAGAAPLRRYPRLWRALSMTSMLYLQATYSQRPLSLKKIQVVQRLWRRARREYGALLVRHLVITVARCLGYGPAKGADR